MPPCSILLLCLGIGVVANVLYLFALSPTVLIFARSLFGASSALKSPAQTTPTLPVTDLSIVTDRSTVWDVTGASFAEIVVARTYVALVTTPAERTAAFADVPAAQLLGLQV